MSNSSSSSSSTTSFRGGPGGGGGGPSSSDYPTVYLLLWTVRTAIPVSVVIGIPGNLLSLLVFLKDHCDCSATARFYYIVMAAADTVILSVEMIPDFLGIGVPLFSAATWLPTGNQRLCMIMRYVFLIAESVSDYTLVVLCLERLYVITHPLQAKSLVTRTRAQLVIFAIFALMIPIYVTSFYTFIIVKIGSVTDCIIYTGSLGLSLYFAIGIITMLLPVLADTVCNVCLLAAVHRSGKQRKLLQKTEKHGISSKELAATVTVIAISLFHLAIFVPASFIWMVYSIARARNVQSLIYTMYHLAYSFFRMTCVTHWTNFLVYLTRMPRFRRQLLDLPVISCIKKCCPDVY